MASDEELSIVLSKAERASLKKCAFPCSDRVLATAQLTEEGCEVFGSWSEFDSLAGWVAGEANPSRGEDIFEQLDCVTSCRQR
jgi:hypothetical protein